LERFFFINKFDFLLLFKQRKIKLLSECRLCYENIFLYKFCQQEAIKENEEEPEMTVNTSAGSVTGMARVNYSISHILGFFTFFRVLTRKFFVLDPGDAGGGAAAGEAAA
jgi:hypothetical protein